MTKSGPKPAPIPLKILKGRGDGRDSRGYPVAKPPNFDRGVPDRPDWFNDDARELWERVAPALDRLELLKPEDYSTFIAYCETWATWREALRRVRAEGLTLVNPNTGMPHKNPAQAIVEVSAMQLLRFAQEFGLTPSAEVHLAKPVQPTGDDADAFGAS
jgi:P27 family predicted phage terminase small subunit